ncbi:unnamed protein product, partial [Timema podura]|nr:unnamed protein product [Timema podura]
MSDISKKFIQRMMGRQVLSENDTLIMYSQICQDITGDGVTISLDDLTKAIKNMNENLQLCNMNISKTICETTGQTYYVLICNVHNNFAKGFSFYTKTERELYRKIVEEIIMCEEGTVSSTICVNLNTSLPTNITKSDAERLIKKFVGQKWLNNQ